MHGTVQLRLYCPAGMQCNDVCKTQLNQINPAYEHNILHWQHQICTLNSENIVQIR